MRALRRQLCFQRLIHRRRNRTMAFAPATGALLASWLWGISLRATAGERHGLPFRGSQRLVQRAPQPLDLLLQLLYFVFQAGDLFGVGFLRHVPAYSSAASKQGQSAKSFHHAKQIRRDVGKVPAKRLQPTSSPVLPDQPVGWLQLAKREFILLPGPSIEGRLAHLGCGRWFRPEARQRLG